MNIKTLFGKREKKRKAVAFVDYEHWYYSYRNLFHMSPDLRGWYDMLSASYELSDVMVFGTFAKEDLNYELSKIRAVTNTIIITDNQSRSHEKDMTDFIMLDYIYQRVTEPGDAEVYVIFTGDGHFQSVVRYLTQKRRKEVLVCGVKDAFSRQLQDVATRTLLLPAEDDLLKGCFSLIVKNFNYIAEHPHKNIIPTFSSTVTEVARWERADKQRVHAALEKMIQLGYIYKIDYRVGFKQTVKALAADWEKLHDAGLWEYPC